MDTQDEFRRLHALHESGRLLSTDFGRAIDRLMRTVDRSSQSTLTTGHQWRDGELFGPIVIVDDSPAAQEAQALQDDWIDFLNQYADEFSESTRYVPADVVNRYLDLRLELFHEFGVPFRPEIRIAKRLPGTVDDCVLSISGAIPSRVDEFKDSLMRWIAGRTWSTRTIHAMVELASQQYEDGGQQLSLYIGLDELVASGATTASSAVDAGWRTDVEAALAYLHHAARIVRTRFGASVDFQWMPKYSSAVGVSIDDRPLNSDFFIREVVRAASSPPDQPLRTSVIRRIDNR